MASIRLALAGPGVRSRPDPGRLTSAAPGRARGRPRSVRRPRGRGPVGLRLQRRQHHRPVLGAARARPPSRARGRKPPGGGGPAARARGCPRGHHRRAPGPAPARGPIGRRAGRAVGGAARGRRRRASGGRGRAVARGGGGPAAERPAPRRARRRVVGRGPAEPWPRPIGPPPRSGRRWSAAGRSWSATPPTRSFGWNPATSWWRPPPTPPTTCCSRWSRRSRWSTAAPWATPPILARELGLTAVIGVPGLLDSDPRWRPGRGRPDRRHHHRARSAPAT